MPPSKRLFPEVGQSSLTETFEKAATIMKCAMCSEEYPLGRKYSHRTSCEVNPEDDECKVVFSQVIPKSASLIGVIKEEQLESEESIDGEINGETGHGDTEEVPRETFKTSWARYDFNIKVLEKKYASLPHSGVEIDLQTFDMHGEDEEVKRQFNKLSWIGERFSYAELSAPIVDKHDLQSSRLVSKCRDLNERFKSEMKDDPSLSAEPLTLDFLAAPSEVTAESSPESPLTRAIAEEPSTPLNARGEETPMRAIEGRGRRRKLELNEESTGWSDDEEIMKGEVVKMEEEEKEGVRKRTATVPESTQNDSPPKKTARKSAKKEKEEQKRKEDNTRPVENREEERATEAANKKERVKEETNPSPPIIRKSQRKPIPKRIFDPSNRNFA